jgi:hypothetical protein
VDVRITFSESVTGFTSGDITVVNASVKSLSGSNAIYDATITVSGDCSSCIVEVSIPKDAATSVSSGLGNLASNVAKFAAGSNYFQRCYFWELWSCSWNWWDFWWYFYRWHRYRYWRWWWWWDDYYWYNKGIYYPLNETQGSVAFNWWWRIGRWSYPYSYWWRNWASYWSYQDAWLMNKSDFVGGSFGQSFKFETSGKKCPATTQAGNSYSLSFGGNDAIFTLHEYPFHFGYGWHYWPWYYYYDYAWYYNYWYNWQSYTFSFWVKSAVANPVDQTLFFAKSSNDSQALRISYRNDKTNYIHVATTNNAFRSNTAFDITQWHHIVVRFQYNEPTALYVDDTDVTTTDAGVLNSNDYPQSWPLIIGATSTGSTFIGKGFQGNFDEIKIFPGWTTIADGTVNSTCDEQTSPLYKITNLPSDDSSFTTFDYDDEVDLHLTGKWAGKYYVLLQKSGVPIVNALTDLTQDRNWQGVTASIDAARSKVAVYFDPNATTTHGHSPSGDKHMIFAKKNETAHFRVCPDATSLNDVAENCSNGVLFMGPFPQTQTVKGESVQVGQVNIGGLVYWYASGLTGSGGQGEGSEAVVSVPAFSWWSLVLVLSGCVYFLWREELLLFPPQRRSS